MIAAEQNTDRQLLRLAAQRQLYATAKTVFLSQILTSGPATVLIAYVALGLQSAKPFAALWGLCVVLFDISWLTPWQKRLRTQAAQIQEAFDCDVLELPWNEIKAGKMPSPELTKAQADKYHAWGFKMPTLVDWYSVEVSRLPLAVGRIACQRSNCWWDAQQRRRYAAAIGVAVSIALLGLVTVSLGREYSLEQLLLVVLVPLAPTLVLGFRQHSEQTEAADRLNTLQAHAERLWKQAVATPTDAQLVQRSRELQDEIFDNRRRSPLVFDAVFKRLRSDYEKQMNYGIAEMVGEATAAWEAAGSVVK